MSQPLLVTGTIGIDTILTPRNRAEGVLGGSVSFAAVAALLFADRVDAVSIIGEDFPSHYEEALAAKGLCMDGVERKKGPSFSWTGEYFDNMNKRRTVCANDAVMLEWNVHVPESLRNHPVLVCCCMVPAQQLKCMEQCPDAALVLSDSMDKWLRRQPELLDAVISRSHITMMNEDEAKEYAQASTVLEAGEFLLSKGAAYAVVKQGEYGATLLGRDSAGNLQIFRCPACGWSRNLRRWRRRACGGGRWWTGAAPTPRGTSGWIPCSAACGKRESPFTWMTGPRLFRRNFR